ncbi:hypothetical protein ACFGVR_15855 [Mucilaginibacter sp. AW1-3]
MKKLLPIIFMVLVFAGCKKSNNPAPDPNADNPTKIVGKWKDGVGLSVYYTNGKEVYRENFPAPTTVAGYYEFTSSGAFNLYTVNGSSSTLIGTLNYSLTTSNTVLHLSSGNSSSDSTISFKDNNTLLITSTNVSGVTYTSNGTTYSADKEVDTSTLIRF